MSVIVIFDTQVKPEALDELKATLKVLLPETRLYDGCKGIDAYCNADDGNNLILLEHWESREHHQKYLAFRTEQGVMDKMGAALTGPPIIRYFERVDA